MISNGSYLKGVILDEDELTGTDYLTRPFSELVKHPDFSRHAMRVAIAISQMTTAQLEELNLGGNDNVNN